MGQRQQARLPRTMGKEVVVVVVLLLLLLLLASATTAPFGPHTAALPTSRTTTTTSSRQSAQHVEQVGTVLVPSPDAVVDSSSQFVVAEVVFSSVFHNIPLIVTTPYFRTVGRSATGRGRHDDVREDEDDEEELLVFAASTFDVKETGFKLLVTVVESERLLPWRDAMVLVSYVAWDPVAFPPAAGGVGSQGGQVPVPPEEDFAGEIVIEFEHAFLDPPVVVATARNALAIDTPLPFALTFSKVTETYAVLNVYYLGEAGSWTDLMHVDWRAWSVISSSSSSRTTTTTTTTSSDSSSSGSKADMASVFGHSNWEVGWTPLTEPQATVGLSRSFRTAPLVLCSILNDLDDEQLYEDDGNMDGAADGEGHDGISRLEEGKSIRKRRHRHFRQAMWRGGQRRWLVSRRDDAPIHAAAGNAALAKQRAPPKAWDTYVPTLKNITRSCFAANVARVYYQSTAWKDGVKLGWVALNASRVCLDDCLGHGVCVDGRCECDPGWTSDGNTCENCLPGYWGPGCEPCAGLNTTSPDTTTFCSTHGSCDGSGTTRGTGACSCELGYAGDDCGSCVDGFYPDLDGSGRCSFCPTKENLTCAGHGSCELQRNNQEGDLHVCVCDKHWAGTYCAVCERGYAGEACEMACPSLCAGRGDCVLEQETAQDKDGLANMRDTVLPAMPAPQQPSCRCDDGWDDTASCRACAPGYFGVTCEGRCQDCGGHGKCDDGLGGSGNCSVLGKEEGWRAGVLVVILVSAVLLVGLLGLGFRAYRRWRDDDDDDDDDDDGGSKDDTSGRGLLGGKKGRSGANKQRGHGRRRSRGRSSSSGLDPALRKKLLEQCPELRGMEEALSNLGSDAADWLIDFEKLELGTRIGAGNSSLVYRGLYFDEIVAIKKLQGRGDPALFGLFFRQEAELLSKLHHPHVVRFYGVSYHTGDFYIVTEYCEQTLQRLLSQHHAQGNRLAPVDLYRVAFQVANGMAYLHARHCVHRDLKPENILVDERGDIKICDFGLSKLLSKDNPQMTVQVGTPAFMCPEMAHGSTDMTESVDVYSFGVLLWALWSCRDPYWYLDVTPVQLLSRVVAGLRPRIDPNMPKELVALMSACWEQDAAVRPTFDSTVAQLRELLQKHQDECRSFPAASVYSPPLSPGGGQVSFSSSSSLSSSLPFSSSSSSLSSETGDGNGAGTSARRPLDEQVEQRLLQESSTGSTHRSIAGSTAGVLSTL